MKKITLAILLALMLCRITNAQDKDTVLQKSKLRTVYITLLGVGFPECYNLLKFGYQINVEWSVSIKLSVYYSKAGGDWNFGALVYGIKVIRYFPEWEIIFNNISLDAGYVRDAGYENIAFDVYIGKEITSNLVVRPYWAIGLTSLYEGTRNGHFYVYPGIKVGLNFNL